MFKLNSMLHGWGIYCEIAIRWMPSLARTDEKSTLQLCMSWYIRSFFGFTFLNILYFFKYSCTNVFHRRSLYTFYFIGSDNCLVLSGNIHIYAFYLFVLEYFGLNTKRVNTTCATFCPDIYQVLINVALNVFKYSNIKHQPIQTLYLNRNGTQGKKSRAFSSMKKCISIMNDKHCLE